MAGAVLSGAENDSIPDFRLRQQRGRLAARDLINSQLQISLSDGALYSRTSQQHQHKRILMPNKWDEGVSGRRDSLSLAGAL